MDGAVADLVSGRVGVTGPVEAITMSVTGTHLAVLTARFLASLLAFRIAVTSGFVF